MVSRYIVPFLILILLGGCARTTTTTLDMVIEVSDSSQYEDGLVLFEGNWDELVRMDDGLTTKGCRIFFGLNDTACSQKWRILDYDDKVSFFYENVSVFKRGLWNYRRTQEHMGALNNEEEMTEEEFREELSSFISPQRALECVAKKFIHKDFCLLFYEPFATPTETEKASDYWLQEDYVHITAEAH